MASAKDLRSVEDACPWLQEDWQADVALVAGSTAAASRQYAADLRVLARLAGRVPRCPFDETGSTPWTSFRWEIALARKISDRAAGQLIRAALRLTTVLPRAMGLLEAGVLTISRADALVAELDGASDQLAALVDTEMADMAALLPTWRIKQEVRRAVLRHDPEAAAARTAAKNAGRGIALHPDTDDQAVLSLSGPAVPLTRLYATLDARARALKAAGDPRTLDALRFDLATSSYPCQVHSPTDPTAAPDPSVADPSVTDPSVADPGVTDPSVTDPSVTDRPPAPRSDVAAPPAAAVGSPTGDGTAGDALTGDGPIGDGPIGDGPAAGAGLRPGFVEPASVDCRISRPVQAHIVVPVETALGLSNEPAWLDGYGWLSAPTSRQLLLDAELRRVCTQTRTGQLIDLADRDLRPPPTPTGLRESLLSMILSEIELDDTGWRTEPQHDPTDRLRDYVTLRDRTCDGPTGSRVTARRADLDHDTPWPHGPTAAWNLTARARRTHQHKHNGWTPLRTRTGTLWISPAGQTIEIPKHTRPNPGIDPDPHGAPPRLPDPDDLHHLDTLQLTPPDNDDRPWIPDSERDTTDWTWLAAEPAPF